MAWIANLLLLLLSAEQGISSVVAGLEAYGEKYRANLPALQCDESIVSQEAKANGKIKKEVRIEGVFRVTRTGPPAEPFVEAHVYNTVNGEPAPKHFGVPYFLSGAFANGIGFTAETLGCYSYTEEQGRVAGQRVVVSTRRSGLDENGPCGQTAEGGVRRTVVDAEGNVVHVEARIPEPVASRKGRPFFAEIDYAPVVIGGATYWLPARVATHNEKDDRRFEVRYTNFRRFGGAITILPGIEKVPEDAPGK